MKAFFIKNKMPLLLFFFGFAVFWKIFLSHEYTIMAYSDSSRQSYPWFQYFGYCLHQGVFPFWDYTTDGGRTFIGEIQTGVFYPFNLLMTILPLNHHGFISVSLIEGFVALHVFFASLGMYLLCRQFKLSPFASFVAGTAYAFSGSLANRSFGQINIFYSAVWIPWVFHYALKALSGTEWKRPLLYCNLAGLFLALTMLGGHHQPFYYASLALVISGFCWVWFKGIDFLPEKPFFRSSTHTVLLVLALIFLFAFGYGAIQILPSLEYSRLALRWYGEGFTPASQIIPYSQAGESFIFNPGGMFLFIFPYLGAVENSPYMGLVPFFFAIFSFAWARKNPSVRWCLTLTGVFFIVALGGFTPIHGLAYFLLPGMNKAREAVRAMMIVHFSMALLAAFGFDFCFKAMPSRWRPYRQKFFWTLLCVALFFTSVTYACYFYRSRVLYQDTNYDGFFGPCFIMLTAAGVLAARHFHLTSSKTLRVIIGLLILIDFYYYLEPGFQLKAKFNRAGNVSPLKYYARDKILDYFQKQTGPFRIDFRNDLYPPNIGEVYRLETINGYGATSYQPFYELLSSDYSAGGKVHDLLNVRYVVTNADLPLPKVIEEGNTKVYQNPDPLPRAWLVHSLRENPENRPIGPLVSDSTFNPADCAILPSSAIVPSSWNHEGAFYRSPGATVPTDQANYQRVNAQHVTIQVKSTSPAMLVLSENWYPGWKGLVNGKEVPLFRINGSMRGVFVNTGDSLVEFKYRPTHLVISCGLLLVCLTFLVAIAWASRKKGQKGAPEFTSLE
jgi:hypothetical protein